MENQPDMRARTHTRTHARRLLLLLLLLLLLRLLLLSILVEKRSLNIASRSLNETYIYNLYHIFFIFKNPGFQVSNMPPNHTNIVFFLLVLLNIYLHNRLSLASGFRRFFLGNRRSDIDECKVHIISSYIATLLYIIDVAQKEAEMQGI